MAAAVELFAIKNLTSGLTLHAEKNGIIEVVEFSPQTFVFQTPARAGNGQLLEIFGRLILDNRVNKFEATARIVSVTPTIENLNRFTVHLYQYDKPVWEAFLQALSARQDNVNRIFEAIKGESEDV